MATSEIALAKFAALDAVGEEEVFEQIASGVSMREMYV